MATPRELSVFGKDYGTSELKFWRATLGNVPDAIENRDYFPDTRSSTVRMSGGPDERLLVVGPDVANFVEGKRGIAERMFYPMRSGVIDREAYRSWSVVKELTRYPLLRDVPWNPGFEGVKAVAAFPPRRRGGTGPGSHSRPRSSTPRRRRAPPPDSRVSVPHSTVDNPWVSALSKRRAKNGDEG